MRLHSKTVFITTLIIGTVISFSTNADVKPSQVAVADWPMFQGNPQHTGYLPITVNAQKFHLGWEKQIAQRNALNFPTTANGMLYISTTTQIFMDDSQLLGIDIVTGKTKWQVDLGSICSATGPVYDSGKLYIQVIDGQQLNGTFDAYNADTGASIFSSSFLATQPYKYLPPTIYNHNAYMVGGSYGGSYSFDESGKESWYASLPQYDMWTPAVDGKYAIAYTGSGNMGAITGILSVLNRTNGHLLFQISDPVFDGSARLNSAPVIDETHQLVFTSSSIMSGTPGRLTAYDLHSKTVKYAISTDESNNSEGYTGQAALGWNTIYIVMNNQLDAIDETTGKILWAWASPINNDFNDPLFIAAPIITNNVIFVSSKNATYAIDKNTHQMVWQYKVGGYLAINQNNLFIAGTDGFVYDIALT